MKQKSGPGKVPAEQVLKDIWRQTRRQYSAEENVRIVTSKFARRCRNFDTTAARAQMALAEHHDMINARSLRSALRPVSLGMNQPQRRL